MSRLLVPNQIDTIAMLRTVPLAIANSCSVNIILRRNGDRYAGEYFADKIHGFGVYSFANGHSYEGSWHEGKKQGFGVYAFRNGDERAGEWDSGILKNSLPLSDPAVQRALQVFTTIPHAYTSMIDTPPCFRNSHCLFHCATRLLEGLQTAPSASQEWKSR
jgi:hypothetical protein